MHVQSHHIFLPEDSEPSNPSGPPIPGLISRSTQHIFLLEEQGSTPSDLVSEHMSDNGDDNTILSFLLYKPAPSVMVASAPTPTHLTLLTGLPTTMNFTYVFVSSGQGVLGVAFPGCLVASAANTNIVVNTPAGGAGTVGSVSAWGFTN